MAEAGPYHDLLEFVCKQAGVSKDGEGGAVGLVVVGGKHGNSFELVGNRGSMQELPAILEEVADTLRDMREREEGDAH